MQFKKMIAVTIEGTIHRAPTKMGVPFIRISLLDTIIAPLQTEFMDRQFVQITQGENDMK